MKRFLIGYIMDGKSGGIDRYLLNFFSRIYDGETRIDFLTNKIDPELQKYLAQYQCGLYEIPSLRHPLRQYKTICRIIKKSEYDAAYFNISTAINSIGPLAAKKSGVKLKVLHSHSSGNDCSNGVKRFLLNTAHSLCRLFLYRCGDRLIACSRVSGDWMYPKKIVESNRFRVLPNTVDTAKYQYNEMVRAAVRSELQIEDKHVVGFVGNFTYSKNVFFLLDVFYALCVLRQDCVLMLVGDGPDCEKAMIHAKKLGIFEKLLFLGRRPDVEKLMQAMDVFVLPSRFEGLGIVGIEAQTAGLPCVFSTAVPQEVEVTDNCSFLNLKLPKKDWARVISTEFDFARKNEIKSVLAKNYDLEQQKAELSNILK